MLCGCLCELQSEMSSFIYYVISASIKQQPDVGRVEKRGPGHSSRSRPFLEGEFMKREMGASRDAVGRHREGAIEPSRARPGGLLSRCMPKRVGSEGSRRPPREGVRSGPGPGAACCPRLIRGNESNSGWREVPCSSVAPRLCPGWAPWQMRKPGHGGARGSPGVSKPSMAKQDWKRGHLARAHPRTLLLLQDTTSRRNLNTVTPSR